MLTGLAAWITTCATAPAAESPRRNQRGTMNEPSDRTLLTAFVEEGDQEAFAALLDRHRDLIHRVAYRVLRDWALSEDVVQATFHLLATKAADIEPRADGLAGWLHCVALGCARDVRKAESRRRAREQEAALLAQQLQRCDEPADGSVLHEALARLPDIYRRTLMLHYFEGYPQAEAADLLGITVNAFAVRCTRAREALRVWLLRHDPARACA